MIDLALGVLLVLAGAMLCFRGYATLRLLISLWGALVGFSLGAGLVAGFTGEAFLGTAQGWLGAAIGALVFGLLAFFFYAVSVVLGMGAMGFALGTTGAAAVGITWSWAVALAGVAVGVLLAVLAIASDLPLVILAVLGALAGASILLSGILLLVGELTPSDLARPETTRAVELGGWWGIAYLGLALAGLVVQLRRPAARRGTLRRAW